MDKNTSSAKQMFTVKCKYYKIGTCNKGSNCTFAHDNMIYHTLPGIFSKLKHKQTSVGVLDGHIQDVKIS